MKSDLYTKAVLTAIAVLLAVIAFKPFFQPSAVSAQNGAANFGFAVGADHVFYLLNTGNARIDVFDLQGTQMPSIPLKYKSAH